MKLLVCGGRSYYDEKRIAQVLSGMVGPESIIIHGGQQGADTLTDLWAKANGVHTAVVRALWTHHQKSGGPIRNGAMLWLKPDVCVAFPGGSGTADMVRQCRAAGVPVMEVPE